MKTAKNIALILMCVTLIATLVVGGILLSRVLELLMPSAPPPDHTLQSTPSSSETVPTPPSAPPSVPPSSSTVPIHQCDFTIPGQTYAPTCDMLGYTVYYCECRKSDYKDYVPSLGHLYGESTVVPPTCTVNGWTERTCQRCHRTEKSNLIEASHSFGEWTAVADANRERLDCSACDSYKLRSTVAGEDWVLRSERLEDVGEYIQLYARVVVSGMDDPIFHIYVGPADANVQLDYIDGYLVVRYTVGGIPQANAISKDQENVTIRPDGSLVLGKPAGA